MNLYGKLDFVVPGSVVGILCNFNNYGNLIIEKGIFASNRHYIDKIPAAELDFVNLNNYGLIQVEQGIMAYNGTLYSGTLQGDATANILFAGKTERNATIVADHLTTVGDSIFLQSELYIQR